VSVGRPLPTLDDETSIIMQMAGIVVEGGERLNWVTGEEKLNTGRGGDSIELKEKRKKSTAKLELD